MSLVFVGVCSHGPGITARTERADPDRYSRLMTAYARMKSALEETRPDALVVIAAEHFANFFMNNMPSFAIGMAQHYDGPIEDPDWLRIGRRKVPGNPAISRGLIDRVMQHVDISYCEEWKFDHGIMVPLHHLTPNYDLPIVPVNINCQSPPMTPLHRAYAFGQAIHDAAKSMPERIAVIGTGGISHWPCTPDSGTINEAWDRDFLDRWTRNDRAALLDYTDEGVYRDGGQGGYEIRTFIAAAGAAAGSRGQIWCYEPIPAFACGCTVGVMDLEHA
ncbi:DODA-type extradiol aromatic ring-opening family dioxygenase [Paraburkholderia sediminicola]|uniref:DODA-type extradiol aromatic ring-opening family dioxygenase n=1 Tax=Paraburkholderia sediminicola TaxID=458836 RepID=UPI0038B9ECFA